MVLDALTRGVSHVRMVWLATVVLGAVVTGVTLVARSPSSPPQPASAVATIEQSSTSATARETTDLDGDGIGDILLQHSTSTWVGAWLMNGAGQAASFVPVYFGDVGAWRVVGTADLNRDGIGDILLQHSLSTSVGAWLMNGAGQAASFVLIYSGNLGGWKVVGTADLNRDGIADILLQHSPSAWVGAWLMNGAGQPASFVPVYSGDLGGWKVVGTADLNRDGIADILLQHSPSTWVAAWLMNGAGQPASFVPVYSGNVGGWKVVGTADLNRDGIDDILLQHSPSTWVAAWLMNGAGQAASFVPVYFGDVGGWQVNGKGDTSISPPARTITAINVSASAATLTVGETATMTATATYSDGTSGTVSATWQSSNTSVASIDNTGTVRALAAGNTTLTATASGRSGTMSLVVRPIPPPPDPSATAFENEVLTIVNQRRAAGATCGGTAYPPVAALAMNANLRLAAQGHSQDMATNNYFSHTSLDGRTYVDRIRAAGYTGSFLAENIAAGYGSPASVVNGWMGSTGHCQNIMSGSYRSIGVGYAFRAGSQYGSYWTQTFGGS